MPARSRIALDLLEARLARERLDRVGLALAVLEREERRLHVAHERADHVQPVDAAVQRERRLVAATSRHQRRAVLDVGRVGDDRVGLQARRQVAEHELDVEAEPRGVGARDVERVAATSVASTSRSGRSSLSASAIAPEPVPTSTTRAPAGSPSAASTTYSVSGRGISTRRSTGSSM